MADTMVLDPELDELLAVATQSRFCHTHDWAVGDAVPWDDSALLNRALPYDLTWDRTVPGTHVKCQEARA